MDAANYPRKSVLIRDLLILQLKLLVDALKDFLLIKLALWAVIFDVLFGKPGRPLLFYGVLRLGERFDLWLNLYGPARTAGESDDGLFGVSPAGADTLLGKLEEMVRGHAEQFRSSGQSH